MLKLKDANKVKKAIDLSMKGYMCSESIVMAFADEFDLDPEIATRISGGFAGGMAQGKTCGAVCGAIMIIGLKYGAGLVRNQYAKDRCFQITQEFSHRFIKRRKTLECGQILAMNNINPTDPEEMKHLREKKLCDKIIKDAAQILEDILLNEDP
ncbi:MAG: C_GCAxxG_C_C family protein [Desulfobacteraceae bacterium]|nr:C_GCAxxG_C_C family protein [Desulfobacteraceae bacterium]